MSANTGASAGPIGRASGLQDGTRMRRREHGWIPLAVLIINQLLAGVGVASGIAVGGLIAEQLSGEIALAGFAQTSSVLGAGIAAIPLARLAVHRGRHWALASGYGFAFCGAILILAAASLGALLLLFLGLAFFGAASAAGLQARFAATEVASPGYEARSMSVVLWATTLGSVAGPNLAQLGNDIGIELGFAPLAGPFLFSAVAFAASTLLAVFVLRTPPAGRLASDAAAAADAPAATASGTALGASPASTPAAPARITTVQALRLASHSPQAMFGLITVICSHTIMVGVMVMTPVHMAGHGLSLSLIGLVISIHIVGMYGASPLMGWLADRVGSPKVIAVGIVIFVAALVVGAVAGNDDMVALPVALGLLGLGWSAGMIGGSTLLTQTVDRTVRVPLQGATDALMNVAAAGSAALSGVVLATGGFPAVNGVAAVVLVPMVVLGIRAAMRSRAVVRS